MIIVAQRLVLVWTSWRKNFTSPGEGGVPPVRFVRGKNKLYEQYKKLPTKKCKSRLNANRRYVFDLKILFEENRRTEGKTQEHLYGTQSPTDRCDSNLQKNIRRSRQYNLSENNRTPAILQTHRTRLTDDILRLVSPHPLATLYSQGWWTTIRGPRPTSPMIRGPLLLGPYDSWSRRLGPSEDPLPHAPLPQVFCANGLHAPFPYDPQGEGPCMG